MIGADESQASFTGAQIRASLGLRSTWFSPTLLALGPQRTAIVYGGAASLAGFVRGSASASLEAKPYGGDWIGRRAADARRGRELPRARLAAVADVVPDRRRARSAPGSPR